MKYWRVLWVLIVFATFLVTDGEIVRDARADHESLQHLIARNIILGETIKVCSEYPNATDDAIAIINDAFLNGTDPYVEHNIYERPMPTNANPLSNCDLEGTYSKEKIEHVVILAAGPNDVGIREPCGAGVWLACSRATVDGYSEPYYSFSGQAVIAVNTDRSSVSSFGDNAEDYPVTTDEANDVLRTKLTWLMTHGMLHPIGFDDLYPGCTPSIMELCLAQIMRDAADVITGSSFVTSILGSNTRKSGTLRLENRDYQLYEDAYKPDPITAASDRPTAVHGNDAKSIIEEVSDNTVQFRWNSSNIHVAKSFDIRRAVKNSSGTITDWELVASLGSPYNAATKLLPIFIRRGCEHGRVCESVEVTFTATNQPGGTQTYGIFSASDAWKRLTDGFRYGPSTQATVDVPGTKACTLSVTPNPAAGTTGSASTTGLCGSSLMVSAPKAASGYRFTGWSAPCSGTGSCTATVGTTTGNSQTTPVTANYAPQCTLAVSAGTGGTATIGATAASWTGDCGTKMSGTSALKATASTTPAPGYRFKRWTETPITWVSGCGTSATCTPTIGSATGTPGTYELAASFAPRCALSVTVNPSVASSGSASATGNCGTSLTVNAPQAASGYEFTGWSTPCSGKGSCSVTVGTSTGSPRTTTVTANYARQQCTVTGTPSPAAGGTVSGSNTVNCGDSVTLSVSQTSTQRANYRFTGWNGGGCSGTGACVVTTTVSQRSVTVTATFTRRPPPPPPPAQCTLSVIVNPSAASTGSASATGNCGSLLTVNAPQAATNYEFTGWSAPCSGTGSCSVRVGASVGSTTVTANYTRKQCTVTGTPSPAAGGTVSGSDTVDCGDSVTLSVSQTAAQVLNYRFTRWSGGGCSGTGTCVVPTTASTPSVPVTASFVSRCSLSVSQSHRVAGTVRILPSGTSWRGDCGTSRTVSVSQTTAQRTNYRFTGWTGGGCGTSASCVVPVGTAGGSPTPVRVRAGFVSRCSLSVSRSHSAAGTVRILPSGTSWRGDCGTSRTVSVSQTTAQRANYRFTGWTGGGCGRSASCVVPVGTTGGSPTPVRVRANFVRRCSVTGVSTTGGTVRGSATVDCGRSVTLRANPSDGYQIAGWSLRTCSDTSLTCTVPTSTSRTSVTVTATFTRTPVYYRLTVRVLPAGSGTPRGSGRYLAGTKVTVSATATGIYRFRGWSGGPVTNPFNGGTFGSGTVTMDGNKTVTASFGILGQSEEDEEGGTTTATATAAPTASATTTATPSATATATATATPSPTPTPAATPTSASTATPAP